MAIFHLTTKIISRGKGQSAIAAAAYRSGDRLYDEQAAQQKYYPSRDERILFTDIMAPKNAPEWVHDRDQIWNQAERAEKRKDAQLAREIEIGLPHELTHEQRVWLIKDFAREQFVRKGFAVDIAIHAPDRDSDKRNHHAHLMITTRRVGPDGFSLTKESDAERRAKRNAGWTREKELGHWRKQWEHLANRHLERYGHAARIDHRSLQEQGIDREPTVHVGYAGSEMAARGAQSDRMEALQQILARNEIRIDLQAISAELAGLEKQAAEERRQQAEAAQRSAADDGQYRALMAASSARRRQQGWSQMGRSQTHTPSPAPTPTRRQSQPAARPVPVPSRAPEPKPLQVRPVARAAMEQKPTDEQQRQNAQPVPVQPFPTQAPTPAASVPPPRPEPRPEIIRQAKPVERPAPEQTLAAAGLSQDRAGWRYDENFGWEKIEDATARKGRDEKPVPPRAAQTPQAPKEPEKTKAPQPQQWGYGTSYVQTPEGDVPIVPIQHINAGHAAAEQAAASAREEQQRQKDLAELARAARADDAKLRTSTVNLSGLFESKVAGAIRGDAQKIRAQVREERQEQAQTDWRHWAQAQNPDRIGPREVAGRTVQAAGQVVRSGYRVVNRATGAVSSLANFASHLLSGPSAPPEQPNRISMRTLTTDPEARKQYQLAQHAEAKRRGMAVEALDNIQRDIAAGRDLSAADVSKLPREQLVQIASGGDAYVNQLIESSRKRADEYWKGREHTPD